MHDEEEKKNRSDTLNSSPSFFCFVAMAVTVPNKEA